MNLCRRKVEQFFTSKLHFHRCEASRHVAFRPICKGNFIPTPTIVRLSRGGGDITRSEAQGLAMALGVRQNEFARGVLCHIRSECLHLALVGRLLVFAQTHLSSDVNFPGGGAAMTESALFILTDLPESIRLPLSLDEEKLLGRILHQLNQAQPGSSFYIVVCAIKDKIASWRSSERN